jgi:hypothetical protein
VSNRWAVGRNFTLLRALIPPQPAARGEDHVQLRRQLVPVPQDQAADGELDEADHTFARA